MDVGESRICLEIAVRVLAAAASANTVWCNLEKACLYTIATTPWRHSPWEEGTSSHLGFLGHQGFLRAFPFLAITVGKCSSSACDLNFKVTI